VRAERQRDAARIAGFVAEVNCMRKVYAPGLFMLRKKGCLPLFAEGPGLKPFYFTFVVTGA
jgi:hypothetical protein